MNEQRENPDYKDQLDRLRGIPGAIVSGSMFENFREGWAVVILSFGKAHYFKRGGLGEAFSRCGQITSLKSLYGPGNVPQCKHCMRLKG